MRRWNVALGCALLTVLLAAGIGTASAEETGSNAWCFRPIVVWFPVAAEAYVPQIECEERELPSSGPAQWSSEATARSCTHGDARPCVLSLASEKTPRR